MFPLQGQAHAHQGNEGVIDEVMGCVYMIDYRRIASTDPLKDFRTSVDVVIDFDSCCDNVDWTTVNENENVTASVIFQHLQHVELRRNITAGTNIP